MVSWTFAFVVFIIGFGFLIFIHELGHFLVAKWVGIRCTQFAIGFGHALVSWRKGLGFRIGSTEQEYHRRAAELLKGRGEHFRDDDERKLQTAADELGLGETEYRLNWLPLGGYVKMLGQEDLDPTARSDNPRAFNNKSVGARFAVISAGVIMNMITGVIFFLIAFTAGVAFPPAVVGPIAPGTPATKAVAVGHEDDPAYTGLQVGDRVLAVDGQAPIDFTEVQIAAALGAEGRPIELQVEREGAAAPITYRVTPDYGPNGLLGFGFDQPWSTEAVAIFEGSDAERAGVRPGMTVASVDGEPVVSFGQLRRAVVSKRGDPVMVSFEATPEVLKELEAADTTLAAEEQRQPRPIAPRAELSLEAVPALYTSDGKPQPVLTALGLTPAVRLEVVPDGPAAQAGIKGGDLLRELDGVAWPSLEQAANRLKEAGTRPVEITVLRDGEAVAIGPIAAKRRDDFGLLRVAAEDNLIVAGVADDSPAGRVDALVPGSRLTKVGDVPVASWADLVKAVSQATPGEGGATSVAIAFEDPVGGASRTGTLELNEQQMAAVSRAQWMMPTGGVLFEFHRDIVKGDGPVEAMALGLRKTRGFIAQAYVMLLRLAQGSVPARELSGPVGITHVGTRVTQQGWTYLLYFLGLLSVNLAVINFLPIPIADGGHAVFLLIEKLKGSPVSPKIQIGAMYVGLVLLGGVFLFVTYNDFVYRLGFGG